MKQLIFLMVLVSMLFTGGHAQASVIFDDFNDGIVDTNIWDNVGNFREGDFGSETGVLKASTWQSNPYFYTKDTFKDFILQYDVNFYTHGMHSDWNGFDFRVDGNNINETNRYNVSLYPQCFGSAYHRIRFGKYVNGTWTQLAVDYGTFPSVQTWMTVKLAAEGDHYQFSLFERDNPLNIIGSFDVYDSSHLSGGTIGLWNYRATESYFDNFSASVVPEPSSMLLLGTGLLGLLGFRKKKKV